MWRDKRVLITGGAGVIGRVLTADLLARGARVWVGDLKPRPAEWDASIRYRRGDLNTLKEEELSAFAPEVVFHLAATFERTFESFDFWGLNYHHNIRLSHHLLTLLKDRPEVERVVFASSYLVYDPATYVFAGSPPGPVSLAESGALAPRNICGAGKLMHETELAFLQSFHPQAAAFDAISARIFRVYGRGSRDVVSRWLQLALAGRPIELYQQDGMFDYVLADDVAEALRRLAESGATGVVNVGTGRARRVADVVALLRSHFPRLEVQSIAPPAGLGVEASQADVARLESVTGWIPRHALEDGIPMLLEHEARGGAAAPIPMRRPSVLVTSAAAKVPLLHAVRAALDDVGAEGAELHAGDVDATAIARYFADAFWAMPRLEELGVEEGIEYCERHNIGLVIPTRDGELPYWARHRDALRRAGIDVLVPDSEAVDACLDKLRFAQLLLARDEPAIRSTPDIDELGAERYVVKERFGAGGARIGLDLDRSEAQAHADRLEDPIFQPFMRGAEHSVDLFIARDGTVAGVVARRRELVRHGEAQVTATVEDRILEQRCVRIAQLLGLRGHAVIQVLVDGERHHVVECNPRFGGASTLSVAAGLQSFVWACLEAQGEPLSSRPFQRLPGERRQVRFAADRILPA